MNQVISTNLFNQSIYCFYLKENYKMDVATLIAGLRQDQYYLVTDDGGVEPLYDELGNLLVCKPESMELMPVPNIEALRKLYDIPEKVEATKWTKPTPSRQKQFLNCGTSSSLIWLGQRSPKCTEATKLLIKMVDSEKYKNMMNDRNTIKLKVWEKIAEDLESHGYTVAHTAKERALRTFQKWRNLERTYWRFKKAPPEDNEYPKKRKPYFFDDMHNVLSKRNDYAKKLELFCAKGFCGDTESTSNDIDDTLSDGSSRDDIDILLRDENSDFQSTKEEEGDDSAVESLLELLNSEQYYKFLNSNERMAWFWEKIYHEMEAMGFYIAGSTVKAKYKKLYQKWRNLKRSFIKYEVNKSKGLTVEKPPFSNLLLNIVYRDVIGDLKPISDSIVNKQEGSKKQEEVNNNKQEEINSSKFVNPILDHDYDKILQDPMLDVVTLDVATTDQTPESPVDTVCANVNNDTSSDCKPTLEQKPTISEQSAICDMLLQIKSVHEKNLAVQHENFVKVVSLLKEQVNQQQTLNSLFVQYVADQAREKSERKKHKSERHSSKRSRSSSSEILNGALHEAMEIVDVDN